MSNRLKKLKVCTGVCGFILIAATFGVTWFLRKKIKDECKDQIIMTEDNSD
jgi:hypothetical protein